MFGELPEAVVNKSREHVDKIIKLDDKVDILEAAIFKYLSKIRQLPLTEEEGKTHQNLMTATVSLENLADLVETEISGLVKRFIEKERQVSETTKEIFTDLYEEVQKSIDLAVLSIQNNDQNAAIEVYNKKDTIEELIESLMVRKAETLGRDKAAELETARLEISLFDKMSRTYALARRIARLTVPQEIR